MRAIVTGINRVGKPLRASRACPAPALPLPLQRRALTKAEQAYGPAVARDLTKTIDRLQERQGWLERCMLAMAMTLPKAVLWQKIRSLRKLLKPV